MVYLLPIALSILLWLSNTAYAATYHVRKDGSDAHSCASAQTNDASRAKLTIAAGISCLSSGDTLTVHAGTYDESIDIDTVPSGNGSFASATILQGAPGEARPWVRSPVSGQASFISGSLRDAWIIIRRFVVGGASLSQPHNSHGMYFDTTDRLRIEDNIARYVNENGISSFRNNNNEFLNNEIYSVSMRFNQPWEDGPGHGFYVGARKEFGERGGSGHLFEGNYVHDCDSRQCYAFHLYKDIDNAIVRRNRVERARTGGIISFGTGNQVYNNVFANNEDVGFGNQGGSQQTPTLFYGNTFVGNRAGGVAVFNGGSAVLKNNIFSNTGSASVNNGGSFSGSQSNLCYNSSGSACTLTGDPRFTNAAGGDYHLQAGSPAIDAGVSFSSSFSIDIDKILRPQGAGFDLGAYEYTGSPRNPLSAPANFRIAVR
jgi:Right handed beta helix region